jgi:hypothetical protein
MKIKSGCNIKFKKYCKTNDFYNKENWIENILYFYGKITDAGGKRKINIHINDEKYGYLTIDCKKKDLQKNNWKLYQKIGIEAKVLQNAKNPHEIKSAELIRFLTFEKKTTDEELENLKGIKYHLQSDLNLV